MINLNDPSHDLFASFFMGGFECATHGRRDRQRIDVIAATGHDRLCDEDYALLGSLGVRTVRDGLRWHLIETTPGVYDWSSFLPMLEASTRTGTQVVWDLCHWGVPDDLTPFSPDFSSRFAAFAAAAARVICNHMLNAGVARTNVYCPINEISFWAWVGGDEEHFHPYGSGQGPELKQQLVAASLAAIRAIREIDPTARFLQVEPIINISADPGKPEEEEEAARHTESQYEAWDMLAGRDDVELGGFEEALDLLGVNYYWNNQWIHEGDRTPPGHDQHLPLHEMLERLWLRYGRPILITETGSEGAVAAGWLGYICAEVRQAIRRGVPVLGICLYPVMDYQGWDDERHCSVGLIEVEPGWSKRSVREELAAELLAQQRLFEPALSSRSEDAAITQRIK